MIDLFVGYLANASVPRECELLGADQRQLKWDSAAHSPQGGLG